MLAIDIFGVVLDILVHIRCLVYNFDAKKIADLPSLNFSMLKMDNLIVYTTRCVMICRICCCDYRMLVVSWYCGCILHGTCL